MTDVPFAAVSGEPLHRLPEARIRCNANVRIKAAKALTKALSLDLPLFLQQRADEVIEHMSLPGTKRTCQWLRAISAFGGKADIAQRWFRVCL